MRRLAIILTLAVTLFAVAPGSDRVIDYGTLDANQSGNFTWVSASPPPSNQAITYANYKTYVANKTTGCTVSNNNQLMTWGDVIACASTHTASQQSESVSGSYSTTYYTARFNATGGFYSCSGPNGSTGYNGTPITLPAGTVTPSSADPISLSLSSITYAGSSSISVALYEPNGTLAFQWSGITASSWSSGNWTAGASQSGAWYWQITQSGGAAGTCDPTDGAQGGGTQMTFSGTAFWYQ